MKRGNLHYATLTALIAGALFGALAIHPTMATAQTSGSANRIRAQRLALADLLLRETYTRQGQRSYYRASRSTRPVSLAFLVRGTTPNSRADWQQRANEGIESLRHPSRDSPESDLDGDGVPDILDRWPHDPNRH